MLLLRGMGIFGSESIPVDRLRQRERIKSALVAAVRKTQTRYLVHYAKEKTAPLDGNKLLQLVISDHRDPGNKEQTRRMPHRHKNVHI